MRTIKLNKQQARRLVYLYSDVKYEECADSNYDSEKCEQAWKKYMDYINDELNIILLDAEKLSWWITCNYNELPEEIIWDLYFS